MHSVCTRDKSGQYIHGAPYTPGMPERMIMLEGPAFKIIGRRRALVTEDYDCGDFIIPAGFQFDGATMPTFTWSLLQIDPFGRIGAAALPHDLLYVNLGCVLGKDGTWLHYTEQEADEMFAQRCTQVDLNWIQVRLVRRAVIWFGDYDVDQKSDCWKWNTESQWLHRYNQGGKYA